MLIGKHRVNIGPGGGGGHSIGYLGMHPHTNKTMKRGDFCHKLVGSRDLQKGGIFAKKGSCLTEDTPVMPIKKDLW